MYFEEMEKAYNELKHKISHSLYCDFGYDIAEVHIDKLIYTYTHGIMNCLIDEYVNMLNNHYRTIFNTEFKYISFILTFNMIICLNVETNNIELVLDNEITDEMFKYNNAININNDLTHCYFRIVGGEKFGMRFADRAVIVNSFKNIFHHISNESKDVIKYIFEDTLDLYH